MEDGKFLKLLKEQLAFFENGGYGSTFRSYWRPTLLIRDSSLCLNAEPEAKTRPCSECKLVLMAPPQKRTSLIPCHHIPLNEAGDTIASLYASGTQEKLDKTFREWLLAKIRELEEGRKL